MVCLELQDRIVMLSRLFRIEIGSVRFGTEFVLARSKPNGTLVKAQFNRREDAYLTRPRLTASGAGSVPVV